MWWCLVEMPDVVVLVGRRGDCKYGGANVVAVSGDGKCSDSEYGGKGNSEEDGRCGGCRWQT